MAFVVEPEPPETPGSVTEPDTFVPLLGLVSVSTWLTSVSMVEPLLCADPVELVLPAGLLQAAREPVSISAARSRLIDRAVCRIFTVSPLSRCTGF